MAPRTGKEKNYFGRKNRKKNRLKFYLNGISVPCADAPLISQQKRFVL